MVKLLQLLLPFIIEYEVRSFEDSFFENNSENSDFQLAFDNFLGKLHSEQPFDSIYLQRKNDEDCISSKFSQTRPTLISQGLEKEEMYIKGSYRSNFLAIICTDELNFIKNKAALNVLAKNLQHMRQTRIVAIASFAAEDAQNGIGAFMKLCEKLMLLNIVMVFEETFQEGGYYYSYTQFPKFKIEKRLWSSESKEAIFPDRLRNMRGKVLITLPDQILPITMLYTDREGKQRMGGYIGKLVNTFAKHYNCTLRFPYEIQNDRVIYRIELRYAARNQSIDFGASLSTAQHDMNQHEYTYPIEIGKWLVMMPKEQHVPFYVIISELTSQYLAIYTMACGLIGTVLLLQKKLSSHQSLSRMDFILASFLNDTVIRGLLGLPFPMLNRPSRTIRVTYVVVFIAGIFFGLSYDTQMVQFFTKPPTEPPIDSFDDLKSSGMKIMIAAEEIGNLIYFTSLEFWLRYRECFLITRTFGEYQSHRKTMDTNYAYSMTTSTWPMIESQQSFYKQKLFRLSSMVFVDTIQYSIPLNENSIYHRPFNEHIMRVQETGLLEHWFSMIFYDVLAVKRISIEDISHFYGIRPLSLQNLYFPWLMYVILLCAAILVFVGEKIIHARRK